MKEYFMKANKALIALNNSISIKARSVADVSMNLFTKFEEIRYSSETIPDFILHPDQTMSNLQISGEIRVAQLLASVLCERIAEQSMQLAEDLDFGEEGIDVREIIKEIREHINRLGEVILVQQKLADGASVSTEQIKDLQKRYDTRIQQLERELLRKEGRALTVTALDATEKPRFFGKGKFRDQLSDLILQYGKNLRASSGGYISLANLYTALKDQVPDVKFSVKDLENACKHLQKQALIEGISKRSGVKIVEFVSVTLGKDAERVFGLAVDKGFVTLEEVVLNTKWEQQRVMRVLESLVEQKIARKVSSLDSGDQYYFPGLYGDDW
jgi:translation initiation factor 2B subunit (eIF-2B alpha/beta/delta family)